MNKVSENILSDLAFITTDIGGTNVEGAWVSMKEGDSLMVIVEVGTWNVADILDTLKLQQAQDDSGTGVKDISGKTISTAAGVAVGNRYIFDIRAEDLDVDNLFTHVNVKCAEGGNTGPDFVTAWYTRGNVRNKKDTLNSATLRA